MKINTNGKIIIAVIAAVLASLFLVGALCNSFGLFAKDLGDVTLRQPNEKNLLSEVEVKFETYNTGDGLTMTVEDDGRVKVSGKNETSNDVKVLYATVILAKGEYTLWGADKGSNSTYHIVAECDGQSYVSNFSNNKIVVSGETATVNVYIVVKPDTTVSTTLKPVLCAGTEEVSFYA